jgi:hypothetical protein
MRRKRHIFREALNKSIPDQVQDRQRTNQGRRYKEYHNISQTRSNNYSI